MISQGIYPEPKTAEAIFDRAEKHMTSTSADSARKGTALPSPPENVRKAASKRGAMSL